MPRLKYDEFVATLQSPMTQVTNSSEGPAFDFWPYVDSISKQDFEGHDCSEGKVEYVYRHPNGRIEHILIESATPDVFMAIVLDRVTHEVIGHHLLNLPSLYGRTDGSANT